jgi:hypothetical protein
MRHLTIALIVLFLAACGKKQTPATVIGDAGGAEEIRYSDIDVEYMEDYTLLKEPDKNALTKFGNAVRNVAPVLREGLPHPDSELFAGELKQNKAETIKKEKFYAGTIPVDDADVPALANWFLEEGKVWHGLTKLCGPFHSDWCIEWQIEGKLWRAFICFGCEDMVLTMPGDEVMYSLPTDTAEHLKEVLLKYHQKRPPASRPKPRPVDHDK